MNSQTLNDKQQSLLKHLIKSFCIDELYYTKTVGIKGSLCVFTDENLAFTIYLDEHARKNDNPLRNVSVIPENPDEPHPQEKEQHSDEEEQAALGGQFPNEAGYVVNEEIQLKEENDQNEYILQTAPQFVSSVSAEESDENMAEDNPAISWNLAQNEPTSSQSTVSTNHSDLHDFEENHARANG